MTQSLDRARQQPLATQEERLTLDKVCQLTGYEPMQVALVSRTVAKDAPLQELAVFLHACRTLNLDPLLRQAYWIRRKSREQVDGEWRDVYKGTLQVGIDGFRALADRQGNYAGSEAPVFYDWQRLTVTDTVNKVTESRSIEVPGRCQVRAWKIVQGRSCAFTGEVNWSEFYPGPGSNGSMWRKMPRHQLAKCAEAQALRKGWPALLGSLGLDTEDGDDGTLADGPAGAPSTAPGPIGVPTSTATVIEQPRPQRPKPSATAADYDRMYGNDEEADHAADQPQPVPPEAAPDNRSQQDRAEDKATARQQDGVL